MKIIENNKKMKFSDLNLGDVFFAKEDYHIKTDTTYHNNNGDYENAVKLKNGCHAYFNANADVELVNCELVIK